MVGSISGPSDSDKPKPEGGVPQVETGIGKSYTAKKAPAFKKWLEIWFHGNVTNKMVSEFEQGMMRMIQNSIKKSEAQHRKTEEKIKERIDRG